MADRFAATLSNLRSRAALVLARLVSISSLSDRSRAFSALARWICIRYHVSHRVSVHAHAEKKKGIIAVTGLVDPTNMYTRTEAKQRSEERWDIRVQPTLACA